MGLFPLAIVLGILAAVAWRRGRRPVASWFAAYTSATACWVLGIAALEAGAAPEAWGRFTFASASLIPAGFLGFARVYPTVSRWLPTIAVRASVVTGASLAVVALLTPWVVHDVAMTEDGLRRAAGPLYPVFGLYSLVTWAASLTALLSHWRGARGITRVQLQYLSIGLLTGAMGAVFTNLILPWVTQSSRYSSLGPYFVLPYFLLAAHAILRHRLLDIRVAVSRVAAFILVIAGGGLAIASVATILSPGSLTMPAGIPVAAVAVLVSIAVFCSAPIAPRIDALLNRYLFRGHFDRDRALSEATRRLTRAVTPEGVAHEFEAIVGEALVPEWMTVLLPAPNGTTTNGARGTLAAAARAYARTDGPAVRLLASGAADAPASTDAERTLRDEGAEVLVVFGRHEEQAAIAILGPRRNGDAYFSPALAFLDELTRLSAMALDRASVHSRELALQREQERVAHLSRLSRVYAGLAHEIRTPLQTISSFVAMLPDYLDDPEYRTQLLRLVPPEVQRILSLADRLRALAPEMPVEHVPIALGPQLTDIAALLRPAAEQRGVRIALDVPAALPPIAGDRDRLTQLFQNLLRNAIEASESGTTITVVARTTGSAVTVQVLDEGSGLSPSAQDTLFEPFVTTKGAGRGLGLSICLEVVQAHRASMTLRNRPTGRGAVAEVVFPRHATAYSAVGSVMKNTN
jgi:signal transduction histidine kinase